MLCTMLRRFVFGSLKAAAVTAGVLMAGAGGLAVMLLIERV